jgi:hypothetical protein
MRSYHFGIEQGMSADEAQEIPEMTIGAVHHRGYGEFSVYWHHKNQLKSNLLVFVISTLDNFNCIFLAEFILSVAEGPEMTD